MEKKLTEKQKAYYDMQVAYFGKIRCGGRRIAIPYGLIFDDAVSKTDEECELLINVSNQKNTHLN